MISQSTFSCRIPLAGWKLAFAALRMTNAFSAPRLDQAIRSAEQSFIDRWADGDLASAPVIQQLRELFKAAGTSPSKYRPSSEALARRVLKGEGLPRVSPLVDVNNLLSLVTLCPCCVMRPEAVRPPLELRRGAAGETLTGLRGPFQLEGRPVLADADGPFGTPITDDHRVILRPDDQEALLVMYLPAAAPGSLAAQIARLAPDLGVAVEWEALVP